MTIRFADLEPFLDGKRAELVWKISAFDPDEVHLTEAHGGWNICGIVEHLCLVETEVYLQVCSMLSEQPVMPPEHLEEKQVDITELFRERGLLGTRRKSPKRYEPSGSLTLDEGLRRLSDIRRQLKTLLPELRGRNTNSLTAPHPLGVDLNACQWVLFTAFHEWSHIRQVDRIWAKHHSPA